MQHRGNEQLRVLVGVQLEIGVLDQQDVAGREGEPEPHRRPFAEIDRAVVDVHRQVRRQPALVFGLAALAVIASTGCYHHNLAGGRGCRCGHVGGALAAHHHEDPQMEGPVGPPSPSVAYPYYTTRGPRDFLLNNPPSLGR